MSVLKFDELSTAYKKRIQTLFNDRYVKKRRGKPDEKGWGLPKTETISIDDLTWVEDNAIDLTNYIYKTNDNMETQKSYLSAIAKVLENNKVLNGAINKMVKELRGDLYLEECNNQLSEKEQQNYKTYNEIVAIRNKLYSEWANDKTNNTLNISHLILALYTMTPPIRSEYIDMPIVESKPKDSTNALIRTSNGYDLYIAKDKVSKMYDALRYHLPSDLVSIINESLQYYPRSFVLSPPDRNRGNALSYNRFRDLLLEHGLTISNLRSAYVTYQYNHNKLSVNQKKELAKKMRHSYLTAECNYNKILPDD